MGKLAGALGNELQQGHPALLLDAVGPRAQLKALKAAAHPGVKLVVAAVVVRFQEQKVVVGAVALVAAAVQAVEHLFRQYLCQKQL